jgi:glycerophosphoryl diester phosphodiesterase
MCLAMSILTTTTATAAATKVLAKPISLIKEVPSVLQYIVITLIILYIVYSILLLFPSLLHKKKNLGRMSSCHLIAHRGSRLEGIPENTIAAFKDAIKGGADIIELDVWLTLDGKVIVHHDEKLTRMTNGSCNASITSLNSKNIPLISNMEQNNKCNEYNANDYTKIPLFEEVLQHIPENITIIVEIKQNDDDLILKVQSLLNKYNRNGNSENVYWFSLIQKINKKLQKNNSKRPTITSIEGMLKTLLFYYTGLLPFISIDDAVFGITVEEISLNKIREEKALKNVPDWFKRLLAFLFQGKPPYLMISPRLFKHLRRRGIPIWFLGVNNDNDLNIAINSGATGVLTDRINWLSKTVTEKNLKFQTI